MNEQLRLIGDDPRPNPWVVDDRLRQIGRRGVAEARKALQAAGVRPVAA